MRPGACANRHLAFARAPFARLGAGANHHFGIRKSIAWRDPARVLVIIWRSQEHRLAVNHHFGARKSTVCRGPARALSITWRSQGHHLRGPARALIATLARARASLGVRKGITLALAKCTDNRRMRNRFRYFGHGQKKRFRYFGHGQRKGCVILFMVCFAATSFVILVMAKRKVSLFWPWPFL